MQFNAKFDPDGSGLLVTFPAIPEAVSGGATEIEAEENAVDALEVALLTYALDGRDLPTPDAAKAGLHSIPVSAGVTAKLAFIEAFRLSGLTRVAMGERIGKSEGEIRRMLDPYHHTKLGALETGLRALGKRLVVSVEEAA